MRNWLTDPTRVGAVVYLAALTILSAIVLLCTEGHSEPTEGPPMEAQPEEGTMGVDPAVAGVTETIRELLVRHCLHQGTTRRAICERWASRDPRWDRAPDLATLIVEASRERALDPYLVTTVVWAESSFRERAKLEGAVGEQGLMQVHGEALRQALVKGYDMSSSWGQLQAGCDHLLGRLEECGGDTLRALAAYQTGSCKSRHGGPKYRFRLYQRVLKRRNIEKISE